MAQAYLQTNTPQSQVLSWVGTGKCENHLHCVKPQNDELTFWCENRHRFVTKWGVLWIFQLGPFKIQPLAKSVCNYPFVMHSQWIKEQEKRTGPPFHVIFFQSLMFHDGTRIDNDTKRPMKTFVDGNKDQFLLEDIDSLLCSPRRNPFFSFVQNAWIEMRRKDMDFTLIILRYPEFAVLVS